MNLNRYRHTGSFEHRLNAGKFICRYFASQQMIECQHTVRFTAAKSSFQLDDWLTICTGHSFEGLYQQALHSLSHIGPRKEFYGIPILK